MTNLSNIPQRVDSLDPITSREQRAEMVWIRETVSWCLARVEMSADIAVEFNGRFTARMGDARVTNFSASKGLVRLSASPLWRRATPVKRRNTVVHEVAHILAQLLAGPLLKVGHGCGWKRMMVRLGEEPRRCHSVNRDGLRRGRGRARRAHVEPVARRSDGSPVPDWAIFNPGGVGLELAVEILRQNARTVTVRLLEDWGHRPAGFVMRADPANLAA